MSRPFWVCHVYSAHSVRALTMFSYLLLGKTFGNYQPQLNQPRGKYLKVIQVLNSQVLDELPSQCPQPQMDLQAADSLVDLASPRQLQHQTLLSLLFRAPLRKREDVLIAEKFLIKVPVTLTASQDHDIGTNSTTAVKDLTTKHTPSSLTPILHLLSLGWFRSPGFLQPLSPNATSQKTK